MMFGLKYNTTKSKYYSMSVYLIIDNKMSATATNVKTVKSTTADNLHSSYSMLKMEVVFRSELSIFARNSSLYCI